MMQPNELRIGNWVVRKDRQSGKFICYEQVNYLKKSIKYGELPSSYCVGIPLTTEILEKCGFEYWTQDHICTDPADAYWVSKKIPFSISNLSWKIQKIGIKIKYLHQLQNLFYWLSGGEELSPQL